MQISIDQSSILSILSVNDKSRSSQAKDVVLSSIVYIIWFIWYSRNQVRFQNNRVPCDRIISTVKAVVALLRNLSTGTYRNSISEFKFLKSFNISLHAPSSPNIFQVIWHKPPCSWIKCNSDGASRGNLGLAALGGIFKDSSGAFVGCFHIIWESQLPLKQN